MLATFLILMNLLRRTVLEAIIESDWAVAAFDHFYCPKMRDGPYPPEPCPSMRVLMRDYPRLACQLMDKLIIEDTDSKTYDFSLFEQIYFIKSGND